MIGKRGYAAWLGLVLLFTQETASAQQNTARPPVWPTAGSAQPSSTPAGTLSVQPTSVASAVPLAEIPDRCRAQVRGVLMQSTLSGSGPVEQFPGKPGLYFWFLDHPDRAAKAWRQMGVACQEIVNRGDGRFGWTDGHGSDLRWETVYRAPRMHIWYAEGTVNPGAIFPTVPIRAVVVMHHADAVDAQGESHITHHADLFVQTDSKAAAMIVRLFGPSVPKLTEECLGQMEMFFSALTNYVQRHPEKAEALLR
jgi:hypothetical protein